MAGQDNKGCKKTKILGLWSYVNDREKSATRCLLNWIGMVSLETIWQYIDGKLILQSMGTLEMDEFMGNWL
jgi:hypothetical protein